MVAQSVRGRWVQFTNVERDDAFRAKFRSLISKSDRRQLSGVYTQHIVLGRFCNGIYLKSIYILRRKQALRYALSTPISGWIFFPKLSMPTKKSSKVNIIPLVPGDFCDLVQQPRDLLETSHQCPRVHIHSSLGQIDRLRR